MSFELPMFPLSTVLLPHQALPLHVFEPRYRAMMSAIRGTTDEFGVVLIERGAEVGGHDTRARIGTVGRIATAEQLDDGRWLLVAVGTDRLRVEAWLDDAPYPRAAVTRLDEPQPSDDDRARRGALTPQLERILALHAEVTATAPIALEAVDDVQMWMWQPAVVAPLGPFDTQRVVAGGSWNARLNVIAAAFDELEAVLQFRTETS
ncbi:MAG: LON peptidase substrate-binding domain-containing protein [Nitriliruptoraceae bacterium]